MNAEVRVSLDFPLPSPAGVGRGTVVFVAGTCYCPTEQIRALRLLVDGSPQQLLAHSMPRLDFHEAEVAEGRDPLHHSYRSGFWGFAALGPQPRETCRLGLEAELADSRPAVAELGRIEIGERQAASNERAVRAPQIAICMATYNPPPALFQRQIESIRSQSHRDWRCYVSDDCSSPTSFQALREVIGDDERFVVSRSPRRLGFYLNFERALGLPAPEIPLIALADQDDRWHPDKLAVLLEHMGDAKLVYSDARVVSPDGGVISETYWSQRRNNHSSMLSLLVANSVTGAASLLRREVVQRALPFPPAQFAHYHDHWLGLVALSLGRIEFVRRPLYDYVQHGEASLGHATATRMTALGERLRTQRPLRERVRDWRLHYFVDACRLMAAARILLLRCGPELSRGKRRALQRFLGTERSNLALAQLGVRGARELLGRPETLGAEWMLAHAFLWRRLLGASARDRPQRHGRLDAVPPPTLRLSPVRLELAGPVAAIAEKIAPLELAASEAAPPRVNLLVPTIDLRHFFGGYIAKFNLALRLAQRGHRVRVVTVDPLESLGRDWKRQVEGYAGLSGLFEHVEVEFGRGARVEVSPRDAFIATTWWTAHIAAAALRSLGGERFAYLIQEYEPFTFAMGSYAALAAESYRKPHFAIVSSQPLRDYFAAHGIGSDDAVVFQNAITDVAPPSAEDLKVRPTKKLLFYARPEAHAARNMFELGMLALARAVDEGILTADWELDGIGSVQRGRRLPLSGSRTLYLRPRADQSAYAGLLRDHDVGLALMYTPHPSLVPIEMASAGMLSVTNTFETKTGEWLRGVSPNLIAAEPTIEDVVSGLRAAVAGAGDAERRVRGSAVNWSRDWQSSFPDELLARLEAAIGLTPER